MVFIQDYNVSVGSLSARRAWIEIHIPRSAGPWQAVALRKESVDRNIMRIRTVIGCVYVALRKESVDRNAYGRRITRKITVALRKESVDRNVITCIFLLLLILSLSARRAWIEILQSPTKQI